MESTLGEASSLEMSVELFRDCCAIEWSALLSSEHEASFGPSIACRPLLGVLATAVFPQGCHDRCGHREGSPTAIRLWLNEL
jgi:hypothetical protein